MRFLLDTHTLLWVSTAPEFLSDRAKELFSQPNHDFFVSAVSSFELATKHRLGKLRQAEKLLADFEKHMEFAGFHLLPITSLHGRTAGAYEQAHKDPFDRILAAQAKLEGLTLLSADTQFGQLRRSARLVGKCVGKAKLYFRLLAGSSPQLMKRPACDKFICKITVELPDDLAARPCPGREALEALARAGYRSGALSALQTRMLLGFETRYELDGFLKQHQVAEWAYSAEDLESDLAGSTSRHDRCCRYHAAQLADPGKT